MAIAERSAETIWRGTLADGTGTIRPASGALGELPVTWASRDLRVRGRVPGLDARGFQETVDEAAALCPVSRLFAGAKITVTAALDPAG
jgi:organic hydroperoxide reductase OsmC/OhrA